MAAVFQVVLMAVYAVNRLWGSPGVLTTAALLGLTDVDALTVSMARGMPQSATLELAARAIAIGVAANVTLKLLLAVTLATRRFRRIAGGTLAAMLFVAVVWLL